MYNSNFLIMSNPTYRTTSRLIDTFKRIMSYDENEEFIISSQNLYNIINQDINCISNKNHTTSAKRKISELRKFNFIEMDFLNEKEVKIKKNLIIENLKPITKDNIICEQEFMSNALILCLMKNNTIKLLYDLIINVNKIWIEKYKRNRKGLLLSELMYLFYYLKKFEHSNNISLDMVTDKIIRRRLEADKCKGTKKDFYENKVKEIMKDIKKPPQIKSVKDYIDTLFRTLNTTSLFKTDNYSKKSDTYVNHMICINETFKDKLLFFINLKIEEFKKIINNNNFSKKLYSKFNYKSAYKDNEIIVEEIKLNPENFIEDLNNKNLKKMSWWEFEFRGTIDTFNEVKQNNKKMYPYLEKRFATKVDNSGKPYNGTTSGIADCTIVFPTTILNVEFTTIVNSYTQCNKEFIPCKKHIENDLIFYKKNKGISLIVSSKISKDLEKEIMCSNHSNKSINNESIIMFAFNLEDYKKFIINLTENKIESFFEFLWSIEDSKYSNNYLKEVLDAFNLKYINKSVK